MKVYGWWSSASTRQAPLALTTNSKEVLCVSSAAVEVVELMLLLLLLVLLVLLLLLSVVIKSRKILRGYIISLFVCKLKLSSKWYHNTANCL